MATQEIIMKVSENITSMIESATCRQDLKDAGQHWLDSVGTDKMDEASARLIGQLEENVRTIDDCIEVLLTPAAVEKFGQEGRDAFLKRARRAKGSGAKYCVCDACTAGSNILEMKNDLLR